ncbi:MAG: ABC transporter permease [Chloroflexi bacterium]|nr:ABC transporter permease [Chloroflexota bacterium]
MAQQSLRQQSASSVSEAGRLANGAEPRVRDNRFETLRRFFRNPLAVIGLVILVLVVLIAILAPAIEPYSWSRQDILHRFSPPSAQHWFGTDELGRDELSRIMFGAHISLSIAVLAVTVSVIPGTILGLLAGYYRHLDGVLMRLIDIMMAFPGILLAIAIVAALGPSVTNVIIAIAVNEVPGFVRLIRASVLSLREREYVTAARALGATDRRILVHHVLRNALSTIVVYASLRVPVAILVGATLSFLGLGVQPPAPEWGTMLSTARQYVDTAAFTFLFPTAAILVTVLALNFVGDGLRDALDPSSSD